VSRPYYITKLQFFNLNKACVAITEAFGFHVYLVGSVLQRRDWRDVDVRCILDDTDYDSLFPDTGRGEYQRMFFDAAVSEWLANRTGLPIDFQIQQMTDANRRFDGPRNALGIFLPPKPNQS
jgi:hypothetical protein